MGFGGAGGSTAGEFAEADAVVLGAAATSAGGRSVQELPQPFLPERLEELQQSAQVRVRELVQAPER